MTCGNIPRFIRLVCSNESCCVCYAVQMVLHFLMSFTIQVFFCADFCLGFFCPILKFHFPPIPKRALKGSMPFKNKQLIHMLLLSNCAKTRLCLGHIMHSVKLVRGREGECDFIEVDLGFA